MRSQEMCRLVGAFVGSKADAGCSLADGAAWLSLVPSETVVCLSIATRAPGLREDCRCDGRTKASRLSVCKQAGQAEVVARQGQPQPFIADGDLLRCNMAVVQVVDKPGMVHSAGPVADQPLALSLSRARAQRGDQNGNCSLTAHIKTGRF